MGLDTAEIDGNKNKETQRTTNKHHRLITTNHRPAAPCIMQQHHWTSSFGLESIQANGVSFRVCISDQPVELCGRLGATLYQTLNNSVVLPLRVVAEYQLFFPHLFINIMVDNILFWKNVLEYNLISRLRTGSWQTRLCTWINVCPHSLAQFNDCSQSDQKVVQLPVCSTQGRETRHIIESCLSSGCFTFLLHI